MFVCFFFKNFQLVELVAGEYVIVTSTEPIDREMIANFVLTLTCRDHGPNVFSTSLLIHVNVEDINDNKPIFSRTEYIAEIKESAEPYEVCCNLLTLLWKSFVYLLALCRHDQGFRRRVALA